MQNGTDLLYHHAKYGGDRGSRAGCRWKSVMFLSFFVFFMSRFGITKFVLTETPWCSVIFKTIMVPLHRGKFLLCTYIQVSLCTPEFFSWGQIYTKNCYFGGFRRPYGHIFKATMVKVRTTVGTWETLPDAKFCKNCLRAYTPFGQIYTKKLPKITNFCDFGGSKPTFLKLQRKNLAWGCNPWRPSPSPNSVKIR